ncbi:hypothetical protein BCR37DRAFT_394331 [Protomyces lactucae-debilis]|uniref:Spo11/DNA topoisomerase VI subunit A N-terminal domain-containing protein n=1 Tax=Protomyces lactucae-debilis TaxID=2754530 RepID=A0A1Y2F564_PROLT|nr:uncharacterized protein BCR37DRAFT_394331 [Protomyces lactucae-debilis]ORY78983.1 hypothetical protein BCR37DRAFT_394331 [Protomyces lactucae-debilis]
MSAQAVPTDAALALVASLQTRKQGLADRLHTSLLSVLRTIAAGHVPSITLTRASKEETYFDHATQSIRLHIQYELSSKTRLTSLAQVICLLVSIYEGLVRDVKSTKRDLYYRNVALFKSQSVVDRLLSQLELTYE